jgi:hypothetical protein
MWASSYARAGVGCDRELLPDRRAADALALTLMTHALTDGKAMA